MELKKCAICGQVLPINKFRTSRRTLDGHSEKCKECTHMQTIARTLAKQNKVQQRGVKAQFRISDFDDNMLFAELRRRGFTGELTYNKTIEI